MRNKDNSKDNKDKKELPESVEKFTKILILLQNATGIRYMDYKQMTVKRRIKYRMSLHNIEKLDDYMRYLQENPLEIDALGQDILINVSSFFRNPHAFEELKQQVFPKITNSNISSRSIRIWVPGCSTGEEAYSIAINLLEFLEDNVLDYSLQIFATDIKESVIKHARVGIYPQSISKDVSTERLNKFFVEHEKGYQIRKKVRDICIFARQDVSIDPPFSNIDLISFRNVLIYMGTALQKKIFPVFHYALKQVGFMMLGTSESVGSFAGLFNLVDKKYKIYSKKSVPTLLPGECPKAEIAATLNSPLKLEEQAETTRFNVYDIADKLTLKQYSPAAVIVNSNFEVIQFRRKTGPYLESNAGTSSMNILNMTRDGLLLGLRSALNQAKKEKTPVRKEGLHFIHHGQHKHVDLDIIPIVDSTFGEQYYLVFFLESTLNHSIHANPVEEENVLTQTDDEISELIKLRQELAATKEYLQSTIEQHDAANEELRAAYEELQSSNEELQSMNEEIETTKEELQSSNEELLTLNEEARKYNDQLSRVNSDDQNLFRCISFAVLMLTNDLRIRRFNSVAEKTLNLIVTDVGRPIGNIKPNIIIPNFEKDVLEVIETISSYEQKVQDQQGKWYTMQIRPYKTVENILDGVVVTFMEEK